MPPMANNIEAERTQFLGENIWASLAASGEVLDSAICGFCQHQERIQWTRILQDMLM